VPTASRAAIWRRRRSQPAALRRAPDKAADGPRDVAIHQNSSQKRLLISYFQIASARLLTDAPGLTSKTE